ncbi:hypothetical protein HO133_007709 [Letharia lupina]|uniref:Uncharacterized protein n=1 Tax=Letharia lupina TaxID=560253 RepID=A0A8H6CRG6_9LECA|nr:uncharacterized protein HO133_007709 [Letharia lupina]KAF6227981.1 hypothetical protein HO133_007709 [Letharia lupina]
MSCYGHSSPNAVVLPNYGPCNPQAGSVSLCCETGQTCLTNRLCVTPSGVYYNGGCTDSTYKAAICPTFCTSGDANWVVECHGSAVKNGDFCCSVNGTSSSCCNTASNGLGLVAAVSSAEAVSATFVGASIGPASISSGATTSSSGSTTGSFTATSLPTATPQPYVSTGMPRNKKIDIGVGVPSGMVGLVGTILCVWWCIKRGRGPRGPRSTIVEMNDRRGGSDKSDPRAQPTEGVIPTEIEGSHLRAEVEGSPVGPVEMDANQTHVAPTSPPPYANAVAPDNNPLHEPSATPGSWYAPNMGNL